MIYELFFQKLSYFSQIKANAKSINQLSGILTYLISALSDAYMYQ